MHDTEMIHLQSIVTTALRPHQTAAVEDHSRTMIPYQCVQLVCLELDAGYDVHDFFG